MKYIYIDSLFFLSLFTDYLLCLITARICRLCLRRRRYLAAALLGGDEATFTSFRCEAPELLHLPQATYDWFCRNYLDRDYPIRALMKWNGVTFPERRK